MTNAQNVRIAIGTIFFAPFGTPLPTTATAAKNVAFKPVGYISNTGITRNFNITTQEIVAHGGDVVREEETQHKPVFSFEMIETNSVSLALYYGDGNVTTTAATVSAGTKRTTLVRAKAKARGSWIIESVDGSWIGREVIPDGQVTNRGQSQNVDGDALKYPVDVVAYPDATGVKVYRYEDDGIFASA